MRPMTHRKLLLGILKGLFLRFCLFWGIPGPIPVTRMNDDRLYIRACAIAKRKYYIVQKLLIYALMLPLALFWAISQNKQALCLVLFYLFPLAFIGAIAICIGELTSKLGLSFDVFVRREYSRLRALSLQEVQTPMPATPAFAVAANGRARAPRTDLSGRVHDRRADLYRYLRNPEAHNARIHR